MRRRQSWSVWQRPTFFILWSRVSFPLFLSSHHLKDLPNKSIMLNEYGGEWQSCNWAYKITLQMCLINTLVREPLAFHYQLLEVRRALHIKQWYCILSEHYHCPPSESCKSRLSWWVSLIFFFCFHTLICHSCTWKKKNPFFLRHHSPTTHFTCGWDKNWTASPTAIN